MAKHKKKKKLLSSSDFLLLAPFYHQQKKVKLVFLSLSSYLIPSLSLSLTHTHTHTHFIHSYLHTHSLSLCLSFSIVSQPVYPNSNFFSLSNLCVKVGSNIRGVCTKRQIYANLFYIYFAERGYYLHFSCCWLILEFCFLWISTSSNNVFYILKTSVIFKKHVFYIFLKCLNRDIEQVFQISAFHHWRTKCCYGQHNSLSHIWDQSTERSVPMFEPVACIIHSNSGVFKHWSASDFWTGVANEYTLPVKVLLQSELLLHKIFWRSEHLLLAWRLLLSVSL